MARFISAKFQGSQRFNNHRLPTEFLPDLHQYAELVHELAVHIYKEQTNRRTVPREVKEKLKLAMTGIRDGSAIAVIERSDELPLVQNPTRPQLAMVEPPADILNLARDMINQVMANPNPNELPAQFPRKLLHYFGKLGKNIAVGESILFDSTGEFSGQETRFDRTVRDSLTYLRQPYQETFVFMGKVDNISNSKEQITFQDFSTEQLYTTSLPKAFEEDLRQAHHHHKDVEMRFFCLATYSPTGTVQKINKLQHALIFENTGTKMIPDCNSKLTQIRDLQEGWADGEGRPFLETEIEITQNLIRTLTINRDIPSPYIYPDPEGSISLQWDLGLWNITCDLVFDSDEVLIHAMEMKTQEVRELPLDSIANGFQEIKEFISSFLPGVVIDD